jgi:hypothetical protein
MSISNPIDKIKSLFGYGHPEAGNGSEAAQTISYDEEGNIAQGSAIKKYFVVIIFILISALSFGAGRLSAGRSQDGVRIMYDPSLSGLAGSENISQTEEASGSKTAQVASPLEVFASSKGKRYYYAGCSNNISPSNKVIFKDKEMAEAAGYTLAANCKPH